MAEMDATPTGVRFQKDTKLLSCYRKSNIAGILIGRLRDLHIFWLQVFSTHNNIVIFLFLFYLNWLKTGVLNDLLDRLSITRIEN